MTKIERIKQQLHVNKNELNKRYGISEIGVFGSYIHGAQEHARDIDILVDFDRKIGLFAFVNLKNHLTSMLKVDVCLVMKSTLKRKIGQRILREVQYV
ncbi:MAG: nucleotidyltransferase family protein [Endomicrobiales bacterium]|jgi:predicted nucleotidyltransferase